MRNYDPFQKQAGPAYRMLRSLVLLMLLASSSIALRAAVATFNSSGSYPAAIPDGTGSLVRTFSVSGITGAVNSVTLTVQGTHAYVGDLIITLRRDATSTTHTIINRVGRSFSGFGDSSDLGGPYVFSDAAGSTFWTAAGAAGAAAAVPAGSYRTTSANFNTATSILSTFGFPAGVTGTNINGTWTVTISDVATPDGGSITAAMVLTVDYTPPPANDACANAINVTTYPYTSASISNASASDDSPVVGGPYTCNTSGSGGPYKNIWWRVTGICGTMTANLCGSDFDTEMAVFTGACGSMSYVGCNDDYTGTGQCSNTLRSRITWTATQGTIYHISAGSYGPTSATGNLVLNVTVVDGDGDGIGDGCDNCPSTANANQLNTDGDAQGDVCDTDDDNDGVLDGPDTADLNPDQCADADGDGCDDCSQNGGSFAAGANNFPLNDGLDTDSDGLCNAGDTDDDNDGLTDAAEITCGSNPMNAASTCEVCDGADNDLDASIDEGFADTDGDTQADCVDTDDDNDGVLDGPDTADLDPDQCEDADGDGCDDCSQNGGSFAAGANNFPNNDGTDTDSDGQCDFGDTDDDNDGVADGSDNAPLSESSCQDLDGDGCDDCVNGADGFAAGANFDPADDGADFDGDGLCDFGDTDDDNDGLSDVAEGGLGTNPFDTDTDDDSFGDATDTCPTVFGQIGSVCDAQPGPGYTLGQLNGSCTCQAVPCTNTLNLVFNPDGVTNIGWELRESGTNTLVQSGGGVYPPAPEYSLPTCLPNGSYYLVVTSDQVGGGIVQGGVQGGYRLETTGGVRLVDNRNNYLSGATSTIAGGLGFDLPAGTDRLIYTSCDKMDWRSNEYIVANDNPAVAAYHGGANAAQTGYEMWFYDPNGGYSFRRFHSHAVSDGYAPNNPQRACHIKINGWGGPNVLPAQSALLNVKVRGRVMVGITPTNLPWGPACRFKMDANRAECPLTQLMDVPGSTQLSCGGTRAIGTGGANLVHARPVNRYLGGVSTAANRYQFRFRIPAEFVVIDKTSATSQYWVNTSGLAPCKSYKVEVRASFDNGVTWCDTYAPANPNPYSPLWGRTCDFNTACAVNGGGQNIAVGGSTGSPRQFNLYPNPNNGEQLFLSIDLSTSLEAGSMERAEKVSMDIYDSFGKRVSASTIAVNEGYVNTSVDLKGSLAAGMYIVNITAGDAVYTERLVIQP